jgi:hypothetical protein
MKLNFPKLDSTAALIARTISLVLLLLVASNLFAQSKLDDDATNLKSPAGSSNAAPRFREFGVYLGQSFGYPEVMSALSTQRLFLIGLRYTSHFHSSSWIDMNWSADLKPLALHSRDISSARQYTYGGGGSIGLQFSPRKQLRWQPYFEVDGGLIGFVKDTPVPNSRRMNITLDFGPGFYIPVAKDQALKTGVWFFHFSNADTAPHNPSFDTFMVYIAYTFRKTSVKGSGNN